MRQLHGVIGVLATALWAACMLCIPPAATALPSSVAPRITAVPPRARAGDLIEILGENLCIAERLVDTEVLFYAGKGREAFRAAPEDGGPQFLRVRVPWGALPGPVGVQTAGGIAVSAVNCYPEYVFRVPANLFAREGPLASLELDACQIILADGPEGSLLRVSPGMERFGFRPISFTVPSFELEVTLGLLAATMRLRIPGRELSNPDGTIQSSSVVVRVVGTSLELTAAFESLGPEMIGEYSARLLRAGDGWVQALDVEADNLKVTARFPVEAQATAVGLGEPTVRAAFSFSVATRGLAGFSLEGTVAKDYVREAIERAIVDAFSFKTYRSSLADAFSSWLRQGPFRDLPLREIRPRPAPDGGLELLAVTVYDP